MMPAMQPIDTLKGSPLFAGLGPTALKEMADALVLERYPKNCEVLPPAETVNRFLVLVRGRVKITRSNQHDGRELTLWLLGPGDGFDLVSLLDGQPHVVSAWTLDEVETLSGPVSLFREWLERFPPFRLAVYRCLARQLRELTELAGDLALHDTMTRLTRLLLRHFDTAKSVNAGKLNLIRDLSHEELASLIGSVRVVVNRLLGQLKREAIVDMHSGALRVANLRRLLRRAEAQVKRAGSARPRAKATKTS
jgi:CRP/FNR family cyclic AMP-dependent transcriptional regulator